MLKKIQAIVISLVLILSSATVTTFAETSPSWGSQSPTIYVPVNNYNSVWKPPMLAAASAWTWTPTKVSVNTSSTTSNQVLASSYSDSWYGEATSANPGPFTIKLNSRTIVRDAVNVYNFIKSTLVHEYGHEFCLDHTSQSSIMNSSRNRDVMTLPQQFDINEVNSVYK